MNNKTYSLKIINSIIKFLNEGFDSKKSLEMTAKELKLNQKKIINGNGSEAGLEGLSILMISATIQIIRIVGGYISM